MRSWDGFQKGAGDLAVISMLGEKVRQELEKNFGHKLEIGRLDGLVTDVHIYENTYDAAQKVHFEYKEMKEQRNEFVQ